MSYRYAPIEAPVDYECGKKFGGLRFKPSPKIESDELDDDFGYIYEPPNCGEGQQAGRSGD